MVNKIQEKVSFIESFSVHELLEVSLSTTLGWNSAHSPLMRIAICGFSTIGSTGHLIQQ